MKNRFVFGISGVIVLLSLVVSIGLVYKVKPASADAASVADLTAIYPWATTWADGSTSTSVGAYASIAFSPIDQLPYISYYDAVNGNLMLASPVTSGGNCGTNNGWWCRVVDGDGLEDHSDADVGKYSSIDFWESTGFISWKVGITYYDTTNNALKYAVYSKFGLNPGSWKIVTIVRSTLLLNGDGTYTSLKYLSSGEPQIAYHAWRFTIGGTYGYLQYATSVTSGGNCGEDTDAGKWQCDTVDSGDSLFGTHASLDVDYSDEVQIVYYDGDNGDLKYAYFAGIGGSCDNGWECSTVDSTGDVGQFASFKAKQSNGDTLHIAYYDKTNGKLKYATSGWTTGTCGSGNSWYCMNVDPIGINMTQVGISLDLDADGYPIIAYMNASEDQGPSVLNIARAASAYGIPFGIGNCGDPPCPLAQGCLFSYFQCNTIDNAAYGSGWVSLADFTSVAVGPTGLATIAYYEVDDYNLDQNLKVAYQLFQLYLPLLFK
jgi:hypothetical protein